MKKHSLLQRFSLLGLAAFLVVGLALETIVTSSLEESVINRSKNETARFVADEVKRVFEGVDFSSPMTDSRYEDFNKGISHLKFNPSIKRIKVWNPDKIVVWSDERQLVGKQFPGDKELLEALNGTISSEITSPRKRENRTERRYSRLLELYIPIRSEREGNVRAVFEIYQDLESLDADTSRQKRILWIAILAGFSVVYFACFGIVWRASRRLAEQTREIEKSKEEFHGLAGKLSSLINNVPGVVYRGHRDWSLLFMGAEVEPLTGYTPDEFTSGAARWKEIIHPDDLERVKEVFRKAVKERLGHFRLEYRIRHKDGGIRWIADRRQFVYDGNGVFAYVDGLLLDITERKQAEKALRDAHQRLAFHIEHLPIGYIVWDPEFRVQEWNPAAGKIFGWSAAEALGKHPYGLIVPLEKQPVDGRFRANLLDGNEPGHSLNTNNRKDGTKITCEWFNTPLRDAKGEIVGVLSMVHDVTEKIKLEKQFLTAQRMESVGTLAGGIAHDFNNALTGIMGFGELMRLRLAGDSKSCADLDEILRCAERAATLTRQLLTFARRQIMEPINLSLNDLTADLMKLIIKVVGEHIDVKTSLAKDLPTIRADSGQMEQVLTNLCLNARDAMPGGGRLLVETEDVYLDEGYVRQNPYMKIGRYALLSVSDTGIGMDEKTRERVFEPFFTTKEPDKGTGLGLAMVYGIVKQHNGFIHVYSEPGKGTTFNAYFPAVEVSPDAVAKKRREEGLRGGTETILLAEDEETIRSLAERVLKEFGYTVLVARDGEEAIEAFLINKGVSLAVLDVVMPKKGGMEAFKAMQEERPGLKVVFTSGYSAEAIHESFVLAHGVQFLPKPYTPSVLIRKVREALDGK